MQNALVSGILSTLTGCQPPSLLSNVQQKKFYRKNLLNKIEIETQDAMKIHSQSMTVDYYKVKGNLFNYGRSKSSKLNKIF